MSEKTFNNRKKIKIQLWLSESAHERLKMIVKKISAPSFAHVIRKSLTIFEKLVELSDEGGKIYFEKNGEKRQIIFTDWK